MHTQTTARPAPARATRLALLLGSVAAFAAAAGPASAAPIIGLVGNGLVGFDSAAPGTVTATVAITGNGADVLRGIDTRPSDGRLYALGQSGTLYTINTATGAATPTGPAVPVPGFFDAGLAFNPVPDRLRVTFANDQNLRINVDSAAPGAVSTDTPLAYAAGDVNEGADPTVTGVAYTNQVAGPVASTTLYGIDVATASLVRLDSPNSGVLRTVGSLGVGLFAPFSGLGIGLSFDIDGASGGAFATFLDAIGGARFYGIDLGTGAASLIGDFAPGATPRALAVGTVGPVAVPEPASLAILGAGIAGLAVVRRRKARRAAVAG